MGASQLQYLRMVVSLSIWTLSAAAAHPPRIVNHNKIFAGTGAAFTVRMSLFVLWVIGSYAHEGTFYV